MDRYMKDSANPHLREVGDHHFDGAVNGTQNGARFQLLCKEGGQFIYGHRCRCR